jgi:transposase
MVEGITWVGLDAHMRTISVAVQFAGRDELDEWTVENTPASVKKLVRKLERESKGREVRCCYEAGPCGYTLKRQIESSSAIVCDVIAPSLIPRKPGERIKTDRRDARKLMGLLRAGLLTTVEPPTPEQEAVRDLCRCREDAREDLGRARHRLLKMLVRRGFVWSGTTLWSDPHRRWLRSLRMEQAIDRIIFDDYLAAVERAEQRRDALDEEIERASKLPIYAEAVSYLRCFRGIDTTVAMIFIAELHGIERFDSPRKLASYLGVVPTIHASSESTRRGAITKNGNRHIRRALVQAAWQYRHRPGVGPKLRARRCGQPARVVTIADIAQQRLHRRYRRMHERKKPANKIVIAIVRELCGYLWAALRHQDSRAPQQAGVASTKRSKRANWLCDRALPELAM